MMAISSSISRKKTGPYGRFFSSREIQVVHLSCGPPRITRRRGGATPFTQTLFSGALTIRRGGQDSACGGS